MPSRVPEPAGLHTALWDAAFCDTAVGLSVMPTACGAVAGLGAVCDTVLCGVGAIFCGGGVAVRSAAVFCGAVRGSASDAHSTSASSRSPQGPSMCHALAPQKSVALHSGTGGGGLPALSSPPRARVAERREFGTAVCS
jgi:hypothetical protein